MNIAISTSQYRETQRVLFIVDDYRSLTIGRFTKKIKKRSTTDKTGMTLALSLYLNVSKRT